MSIVTITTPFNIDLEFSVAPFYKRLLAWLIDILIIYTYAYAVVKLIVTPFKLYDYISTPLLVVMVLIPGYMYHAILEIFLDGQTLGKKAVGIKVINETGGEATLSQYLVRWMLRIIDIGVTIGIAGGMSMLLTSKMQRIGDLAAGTLVIDTRYQASITDTIYQDIEEKYYKPMFPEVMRLSDRDINGIRNLVQSKSSGKDRDIYITQIVERIKTVLDLETHMDGIFFLEQLLRDYNYLTRK